jgi:hypothetical protein
MNVCSSCFNDTELKRYVEANSTTKGICNYCKTGIETEVIELNELLDFFAEFLEIFKEDASGKPLQDLISEDWNLFSNHNASLEILASVFPILKSHLSSPITSVVYADEISDCVSYWGKLKDELKWKRRFLTNLKEIEELGWDGFFNKQNILPDDALLYRARIHKNENEPTFPIDKMGCPDKTYATGGRANPQGIPYLYLSQTIDTTFYETRATYLDEISIATFKIKTSEKIVLVDFTEKASAFLYVGNIFEYTKSMLLKKYISTDLSKPLRRYDTELDYIPTQFICEFIRDITDADGIMFNSSLHVGGLNTVLFEENKVECVLVEKYKVTDVKIEHQLI